MLIESVVFPLLGLPLGLFELLFEFPEFLFQFSHGSLHVLVFVEMQFLLLLFFDVLDVLQLLLQFVDHCVFELYLVLELVQSGSGKGTSRLIRLRFTWL